jgi:hypothetical protein
MTSVKKKGAHAPAPEIPTDQSGPPALVAAANSDGAEPGTLVNFDPLKVVADFKAKLAEADRLESERKAVVAAAADVYGAELLRTSNEMDAAGKVHDAAVTAATVKYGPLIKQAKQDADNIIVAALRTHPEQADKIRKESGLKKSRWNDLVRVAGCKITLEKQRAENTGRKQDARAAKRAAEGKSETEHDAKRKRDKAAADRGVSRPTQTTQATESAETASLSDELPRPPCWVRS